MSTRFFDLSHVIHDGLVTYPGIAPPRVGVELTREASWARYAPGTEFHIGRIEMSTNTGTYLDTPFHRFAEGFDLAELPLDNVADLPGVVVDAPIARAIEPAQLPPNGFRFFAVPAKVRGLGSFPVRAFATLG